MVLGKKIILAGYSGHAIALADVALNNKLNIIGYTEKNSKKTTPTTLVIWEMKIMMIFLVGVKMKLLS